LVEKPQEEALLGAYRQFWRVQCVLRLLADRVTDPEAMGPGARAFLLRETGAESLEALCEGLDTASAAALTVIDALLPPPAEG
jgi:glutamate-ammonia-ligase adenylyltransferase